MSRIAIASPAILPGDAIGQDVLHMRRILVALGHQVELFSTTWGKPQPRNEAGLHIRDYLGDEPSALLILHHAIGWPHAVPLIAGARGRRVVKYHNVTPAHYYDALDPVYAELCRQGRSQLRQIIEHQCELYLADSPYNLADLHALGADPACCAVVPPFNALADWHNITADADVLRDYGDGLTNLLFVGRRAPNKGHHLLVEAFAHYHHHCNRKSRLVLIGRGEPRQDKYTQSLRQHIWRLGLCGHVVLVDSVSNAELKAYYERASVFVVASEHEGFCVPVVEAMALQVPIVAYGTTAVPHTVGDAGLVWGEPDPFLLAQSIDTVVRDAPIRQRLTERGFRRYQRHFANQRIESDFLHALRLLLNPSVSRVHQRIPA